MKKDTKYVLGAMIIFALIIGFAAFNTLTFSVVSQGRLKEQPGIVHFAANGIDKTLSLRCDQVSSGAPTTDPTLYIVIPDSELGKWHVTGTASYEVPECYTRSCASEALTTTQIDEDLKTSAEVYQDFPSAGQFSMVNVAVFGVPSGRSFIPQQTCYAKYSLRFTQIQASIPGVPIPEPPPVVINITPPVYGGPAPIPQPPISPLVPVDYTMWYVAIIVAVILLVLAAVYYKKG